jgi:hypothetical protein
MSRSVTRATLLLMLVAGLLVGCGAGTQPTVVSPTALPPAVRTRAPMAPTASGGIPADAALKITGKVTTPVGWTESALKAMKAIDVQATNKQGQTTTYTGVLLKDLLALAQLAPGSSTAVFVASDGFTAEMPLADLVACADCIASFREQGGFSTVLPGKATNLQVKGVVEIQVK